jgi:hypothetical protein
MKNCQTKLDNQFKMSNILMAVPEKTELIQQRKELIKENILGSYLVLTGPQVDSGVESSAY